MYFNILYLILKLIPHLYFYKINESEKKMVNYGELGCVGNLLTPFLFFIIYILTFWVNHDELFTDVASLREVEPLLHFNAPTAKSMVNWS